MNQDDFVFTVFTPTYNRAYTLHRVYTSLQAQTFRDFEWLIVDDGSTDNTEDLVSQWMKEQNDFPIRYLKKENGGKHTAVNLGVAEARGQFFVIFDSDDACVPQALEKFLFYWESIPEVQRPSFSGVVAPCINTSGKLLAKPFPTSPFDSNRIEVLMMNGFREYRWAINRTEIMRQFPYPEIPDEKYMSESIVWNRIGSQYSSRFINEPLQIKQQMPDGIVASYTKRRIKSPKSNRIMFQEFLFQDNLPIKVLVKFILGYIRFSLHSGVRWMRTIKESPKPFLTTLLLPFGYTIYLLDKFLYRNA